MSIESTRAAALVREATVFPGGLYVEVVDRYPALAEAKNFQTPKEWDFFMAVSAVATVYRQAEAADDSPFLDAARQELIQWDRDGARALDDLFALAGRLRARQTPRWEQIIGTWVIWNLVGAKPREDQAAVAGDIGELITAEFGRWYDQS